MPLLGDRIDAELCVQDIIAILDSYDLTDVILVGHSMGSTFVPEVGCRRPDRVRHVVCLDGALPPATVARERLVTLGEEAPDASMFDIEDPSDIAWVNSKMTPQPVGPRMPLPMRSDQRPTTYVLCTRSVFRAPLRALVDTFDSPVIVELESGHDAMITHPVETAALLMDIAAVAGA